MRNFIGTIAEKVKDHYRKSGMIEVGGKVKNPTKVKIFIICMLALPLLQFCIFTIYVNIDGILMAFQSVNLETNDLEFVGLGNFRKFFRSFVSWDKDTFLRTIGNSFGYWPVTYLISIPLQLAAAYFLYKKVQRFGIYHCHDLSSQSDSAGGVGSGVYADAFYPAGAVKRAFDEVVRLYDGKCSDMADGRALCNGNPVFLQRLGGNRL